MKNSIVLWVIGVLLAIGLIYWGLSDKKADNMESNLSENQASTTDETVKVSTPSKTSPTKPVTGMKVSLGGIFAEKGNYQCDYEQATQQSRSTNVIYISDGKMRAEFRTSAGLESNNTLMVYDGNYLYVWTEGKATGTKTQPKTIQDLPSLIPEDVSSGRILGSGIDNVSWNCHAWSKDASKLVPPTYVKFY